MRRRATAVYLGGIAGLTLSFTAVALALAWDAGVRHEAMLALLGVLAVFPLSELAIQTVHALVSTAALPPQSLPKMDFRDGIPPEHATLVVVPMMLSTSEVVRREIEKLEVRFLANQESGLFFSSSFPISSPMPILRRRRATPNCCRRRTTESPRSTLAIRVDVSCCSTGRASGLRANRVGSAASGSEERLKSSTHS